MALKTEKPEKTQAELDKEAADKKAAQDLLDKETADKKAAQDLLDKEAADKKAAQDLLDKEAADKKAAQALLDEEAAADLRRRQALVDQENLDNAAELLALAGKEVPPEKRLVEIYNPRNADFRQYSTGTWIMAKQTAWLLDDSWLENQIGAKLLERV